MQGYGGLLLNEQLVIRQIIEVPDHEFFHKSIFGFSNQQSLELGHSDAPHTFRLIQEA